MLKQLSARTIFHDQVEIVIVFNHLIELNDMRMPDFFQDCDFSIYSVNIGLILDFIFFQYFDGDFIASYNVCPLFYFAECSLTFSFSNNEASNLLSFTIFLLFGIFILIFSSAWFLVGGFFFLGTILCLLGFLFRHIFFRCFGYLCIFWLTTFIVPVTADILNRWRVTKRIQNKYETKELFKDLPSWTRIFGEILSIT